jgi:hypothetical protein
MWTKEKARKTLDGGEKMMRRRRNLIRVFTLARRCLIYKHIFSGPRATARPVNIFYNRS